MCEYDIDKIKIAIDGCGVPVHAMPLYKFAQGFAKLSKPESFNSEREKTVRKITTVMTEYPDMVAGTDRICTDLMRVCGDRLFAKSGAAAFYAVGLKDKGIGIAFKIEDGNSSIVPPVVLETLRQLEVINDIDISKLDKYYNINIKNHKDEIVGVTKVEFKLE